MGKYKCLEGNFCLAIQLCPGPEVYLRDLSLSLQNNSNNVSVGYSIYRRLIYQRMQIQLKV